MVKNCDLCGGNLSHDQPLYCHCRYHLFYWFDYEADEWLRHPHQHAADAVVYCCRMKFDAVGVQGKLMVSCGMEEGHQNNLRLIFVGS